MSGTKPTPGPGPWLWGEWVILAEDRAAQQRGEPYWTLKEDSAGCCLARGPAGRKALEPEEIISARGYETDGIDATPEHRALIVRAVNCHADLVDGCNALLGLFQLLCARDDAPAWLKDAFETSHRVTEARAILSRAQAP